MDVVGDLFLKLLDRAANHPAGISEAEWIVCRVWSVLEVSNGGFHHDFCNSSGDPLDGTLQALKDIGA